MLDPQDLPSEAFARIVCAHSGSMPRRPISKAASSAPRWAIRVRRFGYARRVSAVFVRSSARSVPPRRSSAARARGSSAWCRGSATAPCTAFGSIFLSGDERNLRAFAATTADLIRYAQLMAGTAGRPAAVYVDGFLRRAPATRRHRAHLD